MSYARPHVGMYSSLQAQGDEVSIHVCSYIHINSWVNLAKVSKWNTLYEMTHQGLLTHMLIPLMYAFLLS
jgi:hypothetical protein